ncbi:polysaccharide deacetylase family protein [bacterium]|nr:polysaccharide deacetylase family protein [bacterium]
METETLSLAEQLGYSKEAKLLIVHADDIGLSHSVNEASIQAFQYGIVRSGSIMVPCPWFSEIADYAKQYPEMDLGIHLTLTSEWKLYRWGSVSPTFDVPTLLNDQGFFYPSNAEVMVDVNPDEVEKELRAQIDRALAFGIQPSHFDSHMGTLFESPDLFHIYLRLSRDYKIPVFLPREVIEQSSPELSASLQRDGFLMIDRYMMAHSNVSADGWIEFYSDLIRNLKPGITQIIIHFGFDNEELRAISIDHPDYGAAWRQRDFDVFTSDMIKDLIEENDIHPITWREIGKLLGE